MKTISQAELAKILINAAKSDLRRAKKSGSMCITGTKLGNLEVTYNPTIKRYSVSNFNTGESLVRHFNGVATQKFLAEQYVVELDNTVVEG